MANTTSNVELPEIVITPERGLVDQKLDIQVYGLQPGQQVIVRTQTFSAAHQALASWATFLADPAGCIDLGKQKPSAGSYDWVDPMGLIWTLEPAVDADKPRRPISFNLSPMEIEFEVEIDGKSVASRTVQRLWMADGVQRSVVHEQDLRGIFFQPQGDGPFPTIIVVTGSGGGLNENRAAQFASHGYAALALAYFFYEDLPKGLFEIPLEYFEKAIHWLQANPKVDGEKLVITGGSRGGELSLILGSTFSQFKAVIAYVPSSVSWGGVGTEGNPDRPAWTYRGKPVPYITHKPSAEVEIDDPNKPIPLTPAFLEAMEKKDTLRAAIIPVEKINGPVLLISGEDDQMWPSTLFSRMAIERLGQHHFGFPYRHLSYPGTGHSIGTPYIPLTPSHAIHPVDGRDYAYGGNPKDQSFAHADSWEKVLDFLGKYL
jgi:dienelactone hydrolase